MEHYERDLPINTKKANEAKKNGKTTFFSNSHGRPIDFDNFNDLNEIADEYDFYYEKNIRPY